MTGFAMLFLSAVWFRTNRVHLMLAPLAIVLVMKAVANMMVGKSLTGGAMLNPAFAYVTEFAAAAAAVALLRFKTARWSIPVAGALAGSAAAALFPLAGFATGVPACTIAGSSVPVSIAYLPLAAVLSAAGFSAAHYIVNSAFMHRRFAKQYAEAPVGIHLALAVLFLIVVLIVP
jgi:hypothetical protein